MSLKDFTKNQKLAIYLLVGLSLVALCIMHSRNTFPSGQNDVTIQESGDGSQAQVTSSDSDTMPFDGPSNKKVICHVTGAVKASGVYTLSAGSRIIDAVKAAGGAKADADMQAINLAAKVEDASQVYIPSTKDRAKNAVAHNAVVMQSMKTSRSGDSDESSSSSDKFKNPGDGTVHINSASSEDLQKLPGVGPSTAQKIVDYRQQIGRFSSPEQIMDVKGIGPKKYEKMQPYLAL